MKAECTQLQKKIYFGDQKKKSLMVTWDDLDNDKSRRSYDQQANIFLMAKIEEKVEVRTCFKFDTSSCSSSNDEEHMPYDVLLHNSHMIYHQCKNFKEKYKLSICENTELKKPKENLKKKIQTREESLSQTSKTDESSTVEKLRKEVSCLTYKSLCEVVGKF